jgi:hypothetical protein
VAVARGAGIERTHQVEHLDDALRAQVKMALDQFNNLDLAMVSLTQRPEPGRVGK